MMIGPIRGALLAPALLVAALASEPVLAQGTGAPPPVPPADIPFPGGSNPGVAAPTESPAGPPPLRGADAAGPIEAPPDLPAIAAPQLPAAASAFAPADHLPPRPSLAPPPAVVSGRLQLAARLTAEGPAIRTGLVWRVFSESTRSDGSHELVAEAKGGGTSFSLKPGVYYVYCGFGYTGATDRVEVGAGLREASVVLNAGGLRLNAVAGKNKRLPQSDLSFDVFSLDVDSHGEPKPVARDVRPGDIVRLGAATYDVVANYGTANANTSANIEVKAGKLTDVTLTEKAAKVTLKLVSAPGGEAIADTFWSVLTQAGDLVTTGAGAFPSFVLAEGDYTIVARHGNDQYQRIVTVSTGNDADVEVLTSTDRTLDD